MQKSSISRRRGSRPVPKVISLDDVLKQVVGSARRRVSAKDRFNALVNLGANPKVLEFYLKCLAGSSKTKVPLVKGWDRRTLRKFLDELDTVAAHIRRVNESWVISPVGLLPTLPPTWKLGPPEDDDPKDVLAAWGRLGILGTMAALFGALPARLRDYAACLRCLLADSGGLIIKERRLVLMTLLRHTKEQTGKPRFAAIADLVNAAFKVAGENDEVTPSSLEKLWKRDLFVRNEDIITMAWRVINAT